MDALNALEEEEEAPVADMTEEIVFNLDDSTKKTYDTTTPVFSDVDVTCDKSVTPNTVSNDMKASRELKEKSTIKEDKLNQFEETTSPETDLNALLASTDDDFGDLDLAEFDDDDDDLADLENMLNS
jgi:hypothetical protein